MPVKKPKHSSEAYDLDQEYKDLNKRYKICLARFDNFYELLSHPFVIAPLFIILTVTFLIFRYSEILFPDNEIYRQIHEDMKTALTFFATIAITTIVTKYFEKRRRNK